jgi:lysophospholipase L1-like esterase
MHPMKTLACLALAVSGLLLGAEARADFYLKDGDRVVFYGDSITDQRLYTTFAETFAVTRFPRRDVTFVHSGWGGDRVTGGGGGPVDRRLYRDVLAYRPTVMTIMLGMNDASYRAFDEKIFETYSNGYRHIVDKVKQESPRTRITAIRPSPFDDVTRDPNFDGGYNAVLVRYGQFVKELAQEKGLDVADLNTSVVEALKKAKETDAEAAKKLIADRVHPGPGGQLLMAAALLKAWGAPAVVTSVEIDATSSTNPTAVAENAEVLGLAAKDGALSWTQQDGALPMPLDMKDPVLALAVRSSDVIASLNRQPLKVKGLGAAEYTLTIDGQEVGTFSRDQLADGINLAEQATPMAKQAASVHALTLRHSNIHNTRWRQIQVPFEDETSPSLLRALSELDALEADVVEKQRHEAQPLPRRYELTPKK